MTPSAHVAGTTPYPWPWDGVLDTTRTALVVTGWDHHWASAAPPTVTLIDCVAAIARVLGPPILIGHRPPRRTSVRTSPSPLPPLPLGSAPAPLRAQGTDGFYGSALDATLRSAGVDRVVLAGLGLETTVHSTMRSANDRGFECLLVLDACSPVDAALAPRAVSMVEMSGGIFGAVGTTSALLDALTR